MARLRVLREYDGEKKMKPSRLPPTKLLRQPQKWEQMSVCVYDVSVCVCLYADRLLSRWGNLEQPVRFIPPFSRDQNAIGTTSRAFFFANLPLGGTTSSLQNIFKVARWTRVREKKPDIGQERPNE